MEQLKYAVVDELDLVGSISSSSSVSETLSGSTLESDSFEEVTSHPSSSSSADDHLGADPLSDMSSLIQQLPIKRGLSKYYQGKAQSFTSLAKVNSLEDLAKPENPYNKKLKSCRSYGGRRDENPRAECTPSAISRHVSQRGSCSSLNAKRGSDNCIGSRPPIPPHRSTSTSTIAKQTALFV